MSRNKKEITNKSKNNKHIFNVAFKGGRKNCRKRKKRACAQLFHIAAILKSSDYTQPSKK
jgi:hypothetical protein